MAFPPWAIVAGDFTPLGGMDRANYALAHYLARSGREVVLIAHRVWRDLQNQDQVRVEHVVRPFGRHLLGRWALARRGIAISREMKSRGGIFLANGANCPTSAFNWLHIVHSAYASPVHGNVVRRIRQHIVHRLDQRIERSTLRRSKLVLCNSEKTRHDVVNYVGVSKDRTRVVYLGADPVVFAPVTAAQRAAARDHFGLQANQLCVCFVGQLQNSIKNFDGLYTAIRRCRGIGHNVVLLAAGDDRGGHWRRVVERDGLREVVRILGPVSDIPRLLAASDLLILPSRYDSYGLAAQEAIVSGLPVIASQTAGVSERLEGEAALLVLHDPENVDELSHLIVRWADSVNDWPDRFSPIAAKLRAWTWDDMAAEMVRIIETAHAVESERCAS